MLKLLPGNNFDHNLVRKDMSSYLFIIDWIKEDTLPPLINDHVNGVTTASNNVHMSP